MGWGGTRSVCVCGSLASDQQGQLLIQPWEISGTGTEWWAPCPISPPSRRVSRSGTAPNQVREAWRPREAGARPRPPDGPSAQKVRGPAWAARRVQEAATLPLCLRCGRSRGVGCAGHLDPGRGLSAAEPRLSLTSPPDAWCLAFAQPLLPRWSWILMKTWPSPPSSCGWSSRATSLSEGVAFQKVA